MRERERARNETRNSKNICFFSFFCSTAQHDTKPHAATTTLRQIAKVTAEDRESGGGKRKMQRQHRMRQKRKAMAIKKWRRRGRLEICCRHTERERERQREETDREKRQTERTNGEEAQKERQKKTLFGRGTGEGRGMKNGMEWNGANKQIIISTAQHMRGIEMGVEAGTAKGEETERA